MVMWEPPTPDNIEQQRQNRPSLVVRDIVAFWDIPAHFIYDVLLRRGVFKWLSVRRDLIKLKDDWRDRVSMCYLILSMYNNAKREDDPTALPDTLTFFGNRSHDWWKGYTYCLEERRREVRDLCHSPRWVAPDNDRHAQTHITRRTAEHKTVTRVRDWEDPTTQTAQSPARETQ